ncbi:MAG: hypothetical protein Fur009_8470 [Candidatus Microgenomates bacterium]
MTLRAFSVILFFMIIHFPIPNDVNILVKKGDKIDFSSPLFDNEKEEEIEINIAEKLSINPKKIFHYLKKLVGETIKKDELIAVKENFFSSNKIISPVDGIIKEINHDKGIIIIKTKIEKKEKILSPIKGVVEDIEKEFIKIKIYQGQSFKVKNKINQFSGEILFYQKDMFFNLKTEIIENKIIVCENLSSFEQIKLEALGAKGFVLLDALPEKTDLSFVYLKNIADFKKILKDNFKYCTYLKNSDMIYFYL